MSDGGPPPPLDTPDQVADFTRRLVREAFTAENTARQADRDRTRLTLSGLAGCTRAAAYATAGTPPSDPRLPEDARQALLGTWIHDHLLPWMAKLVAPDAVVEQPVVLRAGGLTIPGTLDLATDGIVWDLKSVKEWRLVGVRRRGPYREHRLQALGYALARHQAGHPVRWVVLLYLDRATGEVHVEVEEFTNAAALAVVDRAQEIRAAARTPSWARREARGPGLSLACDHCPWLTRCWGRTATPRAVGAQTQLAATPAGVLKALRMFTAAGEAESAARKDREFAKAVLADTPDGVYHPLTLKRGRPGRILDQKQVLADYAARGEEPPWVETAGRTMVTPVAQVDTSTHPTGQLK